MCFSGEIKMTHRIEEDGMHVISSSDKYGVILVGDDLKLLFKSSQKALEKILSNRLGVDIAVDHVINDDLVIPAIIKDHGRGVTDNVVANPHLGDLTEWVCGYRVRHDDCDADPIPQAAE